MLLAHFMYTFSDTWLFYTWFVSLDWSQKPLLVFPSAKTRLALAQCHWVDQRSSIFVLEWNHPKGCRVLAFLISGGGF